jgi:hypothetical protein
LINVTSSLKCDRGQIGGVAYFKCIVANEIRAFVAFVAFEVAWVFKLETARAPDRHPTASEDGIAGIDIWNIKGILFC